jgi:hypothetical protein
MSGQTKLILPSGGSVTIAGQDSASNFVTTIPAETGTAITTGATTRIIPKAAVPTGSVLQVVQVVKTDTFSGIANGTPLLITGLAATITPTSATSQVLITVQVMYSSLSTTYGGWVRRNSTDIGLGAAAGNRQRVSIGMAFVTDTNQTNTFTYTYLDSPASTSSTTYQFYVNNDNATSIFINRSVSDTDAIVGKRGISTITLMEIAA